MLNVLDLSYEAARNLKTVFYRRLLFRQALVGIATCHYQFTIIKEEERINAISDMPGELIGSNKNSQQHFGNEANITLHKNINLVPKATFSL